MLVFSQTYRVRPAEVDTRDHLTLPAFLDLFQDLAGLHAEMLGYGMDALLQQGTAWVLNRMVFTSDVLPRTGHTIRIETWPAGAEGPYAWRDALAYDEHDRIVARGTTRWLMIDVARRRPLRMDSALAALVPPGRARALEVHPHPTAAAPHPSGHVVLVRRADMDVNGHANNVQYARWLAEGLDDAFLDTHRQTAIDLTVRAETFRGDVLRSDIAPAGSAGFQHRLVREGDDREVATGWTEWRPLEGAATPPVADGTRGIAPAPQETDRH